MGDSEGKRRRIGWLGAELVVIVLGVALGLGVDEWRSGQSEAALLEEYLEQLEAELGENHARIEVLHAWAEKVERHGGVLLTALRSEPDSASDEAAVIAMAHLSYVLQTTFVTATFEGLTSGTTAPPLDPQLRQTMWLVYDQLRGWQDYYLGPPGNFLSKVRGFVPVMTAREMSTSGPDCYRSGRVCDLSAESLSRLRTGLAELRAQEDAAVSLNEFLFWAARFQDATSQLPGRVEALMKEVANRRAVRDAP